MRVICAKLASSLGGNALSEIKVASREDRHGDGDWGGELHLILPNRNDAIWIREN